MIVMTKKNLTDPMMKAAFQKLYQPDVPFPAAYSLKKLASMLAEAHEKVSEEYRALYKKYATKLKEGAKEGSDNLLDYEIPEENVGEFRSESEKLFNETINIDWHTLDYNAFKDAKMSALEWSCLEPIFGNIDGLTNHQ